MSSSSDDPQPAEEGKEGKEEKEKERVQISIPAILAHKAGKVAENEGYVSFTEFVRDSIRKRVEQLKEAGK